MRLVRCPNCGDVIDADELEELESDEGIGCGLNQGDYMPCEDCSEKNRPDGCREVRHENGWTKTTVSDLEDSI